MFEPESSAFLEEDIERALANGWAIVPQVAHGFPENALIRCADGFTDIVTLPTFGPSLVVRLGGGPKEGNRRDCGYVWWRRLVPLEIAVNWALSNPQDDRLLREPESQADVSNEQG